MDLWLWERIETALREHCPRRIESDKASRAAVAMMLRDGSLGMELLFIERAEHPLDPWSGHMAFPGGRWDPQDVDCLATAIRETAEELNVDLNRSGRFLGALDEIATIARPRGRDLVVAPYVSRLDEPIHLSPSAEVRAVHWIALSRLSAESNRATLERTFDGRRMASPSIRVDSRVIWGLTYRMYCCLEGMVRAAGPTRKSASSEEFAR
jgi:8-oxo-dGTP pyrophosphatase MutT (NUDIX family)